MLPSYLSPTPPLTSRPIFLPLGCKFRPKRLRFISTVLLTTLRLPHSSSLFPSFRNNPRFQSVIAILASISGFPLADKSALPPETPVPAPVVGQTSGLPSDISATAAQATPTPTAFPYLLTAKRISPAKPGTRLPFLGRRGVAEKQNLSGLRISETFAGSVRLAT